MVKRMTPSQLRSKLRQLESKQRQAVQKHNQAVRQHNQKVKRAVAQYNGEVRQYNARVRSHRQKVLSQLRRLRSSSTTVRYQDLRASTITLHERYISLESSEQDFDGSQFGPAFLDLSERENANSLEVNNALEAGGENSIETDPASLGQSEVSIQLKAISPDLESRWRGALFALNPNNPDAGRHFCTSAREIFIQMLDMHAPDDDVLAQDLNCDRTDSGAPTRKSKIRHLLVRAGVYSEAAVDFVDEDVRNVLQLFRVFNDGTHGTSGRFALSQLLAIKTRVENGIMYLSSICSHA